MPSIKLRQDTVRTLPFPHQNPKQQCIYWDESFECFGVRVYASGRRLYVCSYRVGRRKRLATLGRVDVLTLDQARKKATAYLGKAAGDEDPQNQADQLRTASSVRDVIKNYVEQHAKKKKRNWKSDESSLNRLLLPGYGSRLAMSVTTADIEKIHAGHGAHYPYAANRFLDIARKMFNWARVAGFLPELHKNPATGIVRFRERKRKRFVTTVEMPRLIRGLEEEYNEYAKHGLWLLLLMGVRSKELLNAKWTDIDWVGRTLFIGLTKNGEPLLAPISDAAFERLKMIPRLVGNPYIICGKKPGRPLHGLRTPLKRVLQRAGLENIHVHDLRRTVGSWLAQSNYSLHLIGDVLNHRDPKTTAGYAYFQTQHRQAALTTHGEQVLKCVPTEVWRDAQAVHEVTSVADLPPLESQPPANRAHYIERAVLYRLVWEAPVSEVAAHFGITDVGLAKACRRASIPVPPRGYWAKLESGVQLAAPPLPPGVEGVPQKIRIKGRQRSGGVPPGSAQVISGRAAALAA